MRWLKRWIRRLRPRTTEAYVALCIAMFSTATQFTLVALRKSDASDFLLLVPGALASWFLAAAILALVDYRRYGSARDDWQEVRVFCAPHMAARGDGEFYPREPTLLMHPTMLWDPSSKQMFDRPMEIWFNDGYADVPENPVTPYLNGAWGPLSLIYPFPGRDYHQVGVAYSRILRQAWGSAEAQGGEQSQANPPE